MTPHRLRRRWSCRSPRRGTWVGQDRGVWNLSFFFFLRLAVRRTITQNTFFSYVARTDRSATGASHCYRLCYSTPMRGRVVVFVGRGRVVVHVGGLGRVRIGRVWNLIFFVFCIVSHVTRKQNLANGKEAIGVSLSQSTLPKARACCRSILSRQVK